MDYEKELSGYDLVFAHLPVFNAATQQIGSTDRICPIPRVSFGGFHPDYCYVQYDNKRFNSPIGAMNSKIVFGALHHGIDKSLIQNLFVDSVYEDLGYFSFFDKSVRALQKEGEDCNFDIGRLFSKWMKWDVPFMLTMNHPKALPLIDLAREILMTNNLLPSDCEIDVSHNLLQHSVTPVLPGIASRHGMRGSTHYKRDERLLNGAGSLSLSDFINRSFDLYESMEKSLFSKNSMMNPEFAETIRRASSVKKRMRHPYAGLPKYQNWRRSFSGVPVDEVDPVVSSKFRLSVSDKVATGGSCFAQHIAKALAASGLNYYVAEQGPEELGYGVYSAR